MNKDKRIEYLENIGVIQKYIEELEKENILFQKRLINKTSQTRNEICKELIAAIRAIKLPVTNSAAAFSFELEKTLEKFEKKYGLR